MSNKVFIVAELSANHGSSLEIAKETIRAAKRAGADAIKLQTYTAETITLKSEKEDFLIKGGTIWDNQYLFDLYKEAFLPWEWHAELFELAKQLDLICFSSPFDLTAVDFLEQLNNPIYKIASLEITDIPLIEYIAKKGKPIVISTGIADYEDIKLAVDTCRLQGNNDITLLKCTTAYPAPVEESNLVMMNRLANDFNVKVGLSDHTLGIIVPILSVAMGAQMIEKHFILRKDIGGPDASFSLDENEFSEMVNAVRQAEKAIGKESYELTQNQLNGRVFCRSLYVVEDVYEGEIISINNVKSIRPGFGLHPKFYDEIIGKRVVRHLKKGDRFEIDSISL